MVHVHREEHVSELCTSQVRHSLVHIRSVSMYVSCDNQCCCLCSNRCSQGNSIAFSNCGNHLYHPNGIKVHIYGTHQGFREGVLNAHLARVNCVDVHTQSDELYSAGQDAQVPHTTFLSNLFAQPTEDDVTTFLT